MAALSKISEVCKHCEHYSDCDNKRMEACGYIIPKEPLAQSRTQPLANKLASDIAVKHDYRNIKIAENTTVTIDIEDLKKKMQDEIYKSLRCDFLKGG